jgi:hypothetical protein
MTELEWLKQESGMTDEELKAMEAVAGAGKFKAFLVKAVAANEQAAKDKQAAEQARIDLETRYTNEFVPEMRKVTQDALAARGEAARLQAQLEQAREYGIVPEPVAPVVDPNAPPVRAPGSPDPAAAEAQFRQWSAAQSRAIITLNDLSAEHFKLFKEPLSNSQELVDEVQRQHTLGHKDFTLQKAWEAKFDVPTKRQEILKAERQSEIDAAVAAARKEDRQKAGSHPGLVSGQPSRFSTYKPSDANGGAEPWKVPAGMRKEANKPWRDRAVQKVAAAA